jgi:hypothetical protein
MGNEIMNVFISHYHEDEDNIERMKSLLSDSVTIKNSSVTTDKYNRANNPDYIKSLLRERIDWAKVVICLIGPETHDSEWVDYEINYANKQGKTIVGVFIRGAMDSDVPDALNDFADAIVGWNKEKILAAISGTGTFEKADGTSRKSITIQRETC